MSRLSTLFKTVAVLFLIYIFSVKCLMVVPQKAEITYINEKYIQSCNVSVRRYGRQSCYYMNLEGYKYHTWNNNISIDIIFNEYLHNEYRRSFVEMHFKLCDMINKDEYVGRMVANAGIACPVVEKELHLINMTVPSANFPYEFPFEKARVDVFYTITKTRERVAEGHLYTLFKKNKH